MPTGTASLPMQTAPSALALIVADKLSEQGLDLRNTAKLHCQKASRYQRVSELQKRFSELSRSAR